MKNEGQQKMIEAFLEALEQVLGVTHTKISLEEEWTRSGPSKLRDQTLEHYLDKVGAARLQNVYMLMRKVNLLAKLLRRSPQL